MQERKHGNAVFHKVTQDRFAVLAPSHDASPWRWADAWADEKNGYFSLRRRRSKPTRGSPRVAPARGNALER